MTFGALLRRLANNADGHSLANRLRRERFGLFLQLVGSLPSPVKILDLGGSQEFWEMMGYFPAGGGSIHLLNLYPIQVTRPGFFSSVGDARELPQFKTGEFDIVFSNSVIEHVGNMEQQQRMAREVVRVGNHYFLQTPNKFFPIEPHFHFPLYQFLPVAVRARLHRMMALGWAAKAANKEEALAQAESINLLSKRDLLQLFPGATLFEEKFWGLTKSYIVYK